MAITLAVSTNLLACNRGSTDVTKEWARYVLQRIGMVKHRVNTKAKVTVEDFWWAQEIVSTGYSKYCSDGWSGSSDNNYPCNWDQTGINYVPGSNWTMKQVGSNQIEIIGKEN